MDILCKHTSGYVGGRRASARPLLSELYAELNLSMS